MSILNPQHSAPSPLSEASTPHPTPYRLGLFGGSFNPIHNCHLAMAQQVHERLRLSHTLFIPSGDPPHKRDGSLAPASARIEMVRLATAAIPFFDVSDIELQRTGKTYTIDTIQELQHHYGPATELFFIIGLDAFLDIPTWKTPDKLMQICQFVVVPRPGYSFTALSGISLIPPLNRQALTQLDHNVLNQLVIPIPGCPGITCISLPPCPISASDIRQRVRRGAPLANMLPHPVESYILQHNLYREDHDRTHI